MNHNIDNDNDPSHANENTNIVAYMNNDFAKKIYIMLNKSYLFSHKMYPKIAIPKNIFANSVLNTFGLTLSDAHFDIARTSPDYAFKFNKMARKHINNMVDENGVPIYPYMKHYGNGYSFIGDAFINFVTALVVFDMFPNESSSTLSTFATIFRNNEYLANINTSASFTQYLTKSKKSTLSNHQLNRQIAGSFKGLIGLLYKENGAEKMIDLMSFVNNEIVPSTIFDFTGKEINTLLRMSVIAIASFFIGWTMCYLTIMNHIPIPSIPACEIYY
jgi:hypothetical protein